MASITISPACFRPYLTRLNASYWDSVERNLSGKAPRCGSGVLRLRKERALDTREVLGHEPAQGRDLRIGGEPGLRRVSELVRDQWRRVKTEHDVLRDLVAT